MKKERYTYILQQLDQKGEIRVTEISQELGVSEMTVRMDLNALGKAGLLTRVHGGARRAGEMLYKENVRDTLHRNASGKIAIAKAAYSHLKAGDVLLVDDASTCLYLIRQIKANPALPLELYTNSILAAAELLDASHVKLHLIGGDLSGNLASTSGPTAEAELASIQADFCFFGANGVTAAAGASVIGYPQMKLKQAMLKASKTHILLADSHKFGFEFLSVICPLSDLDFVITDAELSEEIWEECQKITQIERAGV